MEVQEQLLRRQLETLGYGAHSKLQIDAKLVSRLVADLLAAGSAGREVQQQAAQSGRQLELANDKARNMIGKTCQPRRGRLHHVSSRSHIFRAGDNDSSETSVCVDPPGGRPDARDAAVDD